MSKLTMHDCQWHPVGQEGPECGWRVFDTSFEWQQPLVLEAQKMVVMANLPDVFKHVKVIPRLVSTSCVHVRRNALCPRQSTSIAVVAPLVHGTSPS